jgi:hypothetical protein
MPICVKHMACAAPLCQFGIYGAYCTHLVVLHAHLVRTFESIMGIGYAENLGVSIFTARKLLLYVHSFCAYCTEYTLAQYKNKPTQCSICYGHFLLSVHPY